MKRMTVEEALGVVLSRTRRVGRTTEGPDELQAAHGVLRDEIDRLKADLEDEKRVNAYLEKRSDDAVVAGYAAHEEVEVLEALLAKERSRASSLLVKIRQASCHMRGTCGIDDAPDGSQIVQTAEEVARMYHLLSRQNQRLRREDRASFWEVKDLRGLLAKQTDITRDAEAEALTAQRVVVRLRRALDLACHHIAEVISLGVPEEEATMSIVAIEKDFMSRVLTPPPAPTPTAPDPAVCDGVCCDECGMGYIGGTDAPTHADGCSQAPPPVPTPAEAPEPVPERCGLCGEFMISAVLGTPVCAAARGSKGAFLYTAAVDIGPPPDFCPKRKAEGGPDE